MSVKDWFNDLEQITD